MSPTMHPSAQKGFRQAAKLYQQVRPSYPQNVVNWLQNELKINDQSRVMDLGAGTGKLIPYLQQLTPHILAVEPVAEMLQQLTQIYPDVQTIQAYSEQLPVASNSVDAVLCAQAFHWFANIESLNEIHQVLKPKGHLGLIWNQRDVEVPWVKALADIIAPFEGDTPRFHSGNWKQVFEHQYLFQLKTIQVYSLLHKGTVEQVVSNRLLSTSFIAAMPPAQQNELKQQFEQVIFDFLGKAPQDEIEFPYVTYCYHFQKT